MKQQPEFKTITGDDWKRAFKRERAYVNPIPQQIKDKLAERPSTDEIMQKLFPNDPYERQ